MDSPVLEDRPTRTTPHAIVKTPTHMLGRRASYKKKFFISATKTTPAPRSSIHTDALMYMSPRIISRVEMRSKTAGTINGRNCSRLFCLAWSCKTCWSSALLPRAMRLRRASDME
eukprot:scaffold100277_cov30-Tisochrysis_lutea.AAC.1